MIVYVESYGETEAYTGNERKSLSCPQHSQHQHQHQHRSVLLMPTTCQEFPNMLALIFIIKQDPYSSFNDEEINVQKV